MADDDKASRALPPDLDEDDDDEIDDVTDVWDEERLKAALGELRKDEESGPATAAKRALEDSIQVDASAGSPVQKGPGSKVDTDPPPPPRKGGGLSWPLTVGIAIALGVSVYLLVTQLR